MHENRYQTALGTYFFAALNIQFWAWSGNGLQRHFSQNRQQIGEIRY